MPGLSASTTKPDSSSGFTHAFVDAESDHLHQPSTIRNNLFVGSSEEVMTRVRYRPVETRGDPDVDADVPRTKHHRQSATSLASTFTSTSSDDGFTDEQFLLHSSSSKKIPYKGLSLMTTWFILLLRHFIPL